MKTTREDFPDLLSPMLVKELRQGLRTKMFVSAFVVLQVLMAITIALNAIDYGANPDSFNIRNLNSWFWLLCSLLLLIVMPLRGVVALSNEEKAKTLELIFLTRLTSWRIVVGKWASLMFQSSLFALAVLPYAVLRYFFGNVNLVDDLLNLTMLLWVSSILTAAAVGISGYAGFLKGALLVLAGLFGLTGTSVLIEMVFGPGMGMRGMALGGTEEWKIWTLLILDSLMIGIYLLEMAASQIAPDAENHMMRKRCLAILCLLIAAVISFAGFEKAMVIVQLLLSAVALGFCSAEALCSRRPVMLSHVKVFAGRGKLLAWSGRFFYPGWPGGAIFALLSAGLLMLVFSTITGMDSDSRLRGNVIILTGAGALLTPLVFFSAVMKRWRQALAPFFIVQAIFMVIAICAYSASEITKTRLPVESMMLFPPTSFWVIIFQGVKDEELNVFMCAGALEIMAGFVLILFWSRPYWQKVRELERQALEQKRGK